MKSKCFAILMLICFLSNAFAQEWNFSTPFNTPFAPLNVIQVNKQAVDGLKVKSIQVPANQNVQAAVPANYSGPKEIGELARKLGSKEAIFEYFDKNISYEPYFGSKKGPLLTLLEGAGNDLDQAMLAKEMFAAIGIQGVKINFTDIVVMPCEGFPFAFGSMPGIPNFKDMLALDDELYAGMTYQQAVDAGLLPDFARHFQQISLTDSQKKFLSYTVMVMQANGVTISFEPNYCILVMLCASVNIDGVDYFVGTKKHKRAGFPFELNYDLGGLSSALSEGMSVPTSYSVKNVNYEAVKSAIRQRASNLKDLLKDGGGSMQHAFSIVGRPVPDGLFEQLMVLQSRPEMSYTTLPDSLRWKFNIYEGGTGVANIMKSAGKAFTLYCDDLAPKTLWCTFDSNVFKVMHGESVESDCIAQKALDRDASVMLELIPAVNPNSTIPDEPKRNKPQVYKRNAANVYAISYSFAAEEKLLQIKQKRLENAVEKLQGTNPAAFNSGNLDIDKLSNMNDRKSIRAMTADNIGTQWMYFTALSTRLICNINHNWEYITCRIGKIGLEFSDQIQDAEGYVNYYPPRGYYLDVSQVFSFVLSLNGREDRTIETFCTSSLYSSAFEHGIIEQSSIKDDGTCDKALSTVNLIAAANSAGIEICYADKNNKSAVIDVLSGFGYKKDVLNNYIDSGNGIILAPKIAEVPLEGAQWKGTGYIVFTEKESAMIIDGMFAGGYSYNFVTPNINSYLNNIYNMSPNTSAFSPLYKTSSILSTFSITPAWSKDPVDMRTGAYSFSVTDLKIGDGELPDGISFTREYSSGAAGLDNSKIGYGWSHNMNIKAVESSSAVSALGLGDPSHTSVFMASAELCSVFYRQALSANSVSEKTKFLVAAALAAKEGVDSMKNGMVNIYSGSNVMQFVKSYEQYNDGNAVKYREIFLPPTGMNIALSKNADGIYVMKEPYGNTYEFSSDNKISKITNIRGKSATFTYEDAKLKEVGDAYGRKMYLKWDTSGNNIIGIGRSSDASDWIYEYTDGDLSSAKDCMDKGNPQLEWKYEYAKDSAQKTRHLMSCYINPIGKANGGIIVSNQYDDDGKVVSQYLYGDQSKVLNLDISETYSTETDAYGNVHKYYYDDRGLHTKYIDELGNSTEYVYDSYARKVKTVLPAGDEIRVVYDRWHNKVSEDLYAKTSNGFKWHSGTVYTYESESEAEGEVPRLKTVTLRSGEGSTTGRTTTIGGYLSINGIKTSMPTSATDERGIVALREYDSSGRLASEGISGRRTTYFNFNDLDKPQTIGHLTGLETLEYNSNGDVSKSTMAGLTKTFLYDSNNRLIRTNFSGSGIIGNVYTSVTYDAMGNVKSETDQDGLVRSYEYSAQQKKLSESFGSGNKKQTTTYAYDNADRLVSETRPDGRIISYTLDAKGQPIEQVIAGKITTFAYDKDGNRIKTTTPLNLTTENVYDPSGNIVLMKDSAGKSVSYTFNSYGENTSVKNRRNAVFTMENDYANRVSTSTTAMGKETVVKYSPATWDILERIPPSGSSDKVTYAYDNAGRVKYVSDPTGLVTYSYNTTNGKLQTISEGNESISFTYDVMGRISSSSENEITVCYTYTPGGKIKTVTYPEQNGIPSRTVTYNYNELGLLSSIVDWAGRTTTYTYDDGGRLTRIDRPNGTCRVLSYESSTGRLLKIEEHAADTGLIYAHEYTYDDDGRITKFKRYPKAMGIPRVSSSAAYNLDNQISKWTWKTDNPTELTPVYDDNGNMTFGPIRPLVSSSYAYNKRNRLVSAGDVAYTYDPSGNRKSVSYQKDGISVSESYVYDRSGDLPNILIRNKTEGSYGRTKCTYYVYGAGLNYEVSFDENGAESDVKYYHYDHTGSTMALTDSDSTVTDRFTYDIWGYSMQTKGVSDTPFRYVGIFGIQTDPNGLISMRARYYNPTTKTFITPDPSGFEGGLNWYLYANGNPLAYIDTDGEFAVAAVIVGIVVNVAIGYAINSAIGEDYTSTDFAIDAALGAIPGIGFSKNFFKALKFSTKFENSWKFVNVSKRMHSKSWDLSAKGEHLHHWLIPNNGWGKHVPDYIKNTPWNLNSIPKDVHGMIHGTIKGGKKYSIIESIYYQTPAWAKTTTIGVGGSLIVNTSRISSGGTSSGTTYNPYNTSNANLMNYYNPYITLKNERYK